MPEDRRRFAQTCPKFDHQLEQAFISNKALTNTFIALVQTFAMLVMKGGVGGERVTRAYTVEVQTASVFYAQSLILLS